MADFVELGLEGFDKTADKYFDKGYEKLHKHRHRKDDRQGDSNFKDNMSGTQGRDRGYDSGSDDSYDEQPRRRRAQRDDRDDRKPRYDDRDGRDDDRKPRRYSPPGQSYKARAPDAQPQYQPYQPHAAYQPQPGNTRQKDTVPPYHNDSSRPSSRDYTPTSSTRGPQRNEIARYSRPQDRSPSQSRSRRQRRRSSSSSRSRSRSTSRSRDFDSNPLMALDRTPLGLGAGLAGALLGGYIGRESSDNHRHQKRSTALGAIIGGIGANIIENRVRIYREEMKEEQREAKIKWEARHGDGDRGGGGGGKERKGKRDEERW